MGEWVDLSSVSALSVKHKSPRFVKFTTQHPLCTCPYPGLHTLKAGCTRVSMGRRNRERCVHINENKGMEDGERDEDKYSVWIFSLKILEVFLICLQESVS